MLETAVILFAILAAVGLLGALLTLGLLPFSLLLMWLMPGNSADSIQRALDNSADR